MSLTPAIQKFIELDKKKAEVKKFFDEYKEAIEAVIEEQGLGAHFQDADGTVYQTAIPEGRFVAFDKFTVNRTRRIDLDEKKGTLSLSGARELGYEVEGK